MRTFTHLALLLAVFPGCNWLLGAGLTITTTTSPLPDATLGGSYSAALGVLGGAGPYTWSITAGSLPVGLSIGSSTGVISGTPTGDVFGGFSFTVSVADTGEDSGTKDFVLVVNTPPVISYDSYLSWTVGAPYSVPGNVSSGTPPYHWALSAGALPNGLRLDSNSGTVSGTPTAAGVFTFTLQVTDAANGVGTKVVTITINPVAIITTSSLPNATIGTAYSVALSATGGTPPLTWFLRASPPPGLNLSGSGLLSGTPSSSGTFTVSLGVVDTASKSVFQDMTLVVNSTSSLTIVTASPLPNGTVGVAYAQVFVAINGTLPYAWSVTAGALPSGISLGPLGSLNGTPLTAGSFNFTLQVTDKTGLSVTKPVALSVAPAPLKIVTTSLPAATLHSPYSLTMVAAGGTPPYRWFISSASLPPGLTLDTTIGVISGSPTLVATFTVGIRVVDNAGVDAQNMYSFQVLTNLTLLSVSPLPSAVQGVPYTYSLTAQGGTLPYTWSISSGNLPPGLALNPFNGTIDGTPGQPGAYNFTIYLTDVALSVVTGPLTLTVVGASQVGSLSCAPATVNPPGTATCTVTLTSPAGVGGLTVNLSSDNRSVTLPATLIVVPGQTNATFTLNVGSISTDQLVVVTASAGSSKAVFSLSLAGGPPKVSAITCLPGTIAAGAASSCTITLSKPPSTTLTVAISVDKALLTIPSSITITPPQTSALFLASAGNTADRQVVTVTASLAGSSTEFAVTVLPSQTSQPTLMQNTVRSVANGATTNPPGALIYVQGTNLANVTPKPLVASSTPLPIHLRDNLDDVSATVNGISASMYYALPNYVSFQLPWETNTSTGSAMLVVTRNGVASAPLQFPVGNFSPGIFTTTGDGLGLAWAIFAAPSKINPTGQVAQATSVGTYLGVPATAGDQLYVYAAGLGPAKHMVDGRAPCPLANSKPGPCPAGYNALDYSTTTTPVIMVGGVQAKVDASILDPTYPGLYLVFFEIPAGAPKGNAVPVQLQIPGGPSTDPANVTIAIQ